MDSEAAGRGYLEHLTDQDLRFLAASADLRPELAGRLRSQPAVVLELVERPELFDQVFGQDDPARLASVSPFLAFQVAIGATGRELATTRFVAERTSPRERVPVFDTPQLRDFLADPLRRLFLAELLTSFVRVASGRFWTRTARGWQRRRFSELDPVQLAQLASETPRAYRPGVYRRLGDVSLFLTGVFPDYAQRHAFGPLDAARLLRATGLSPADDQAGLAAAAPIELLEQLGQRWYQRAFALAPVATAQLAVVAQVAARFRDARRVLNQVSDRYLTRVGNPWFGPPGS
ncbi:MAG: hypothetical protein GEV12_20820 [Micromonosporaceae bacterium]|nr:hypothetical protein [Micromonosporaceae bacterium]